MKVVVTGASGNVGTALLRRLVQRPGWKVTGISRRVPTDDMPYREVRWRACDIGEADAVSTLTEEFSGADAVVHLAWEINPPARGPTPERTNATGTRHVFDAVRAAAVPRLVCLSSVAAYSPAPRNTLVTEAWPTTGIDDCAYSRGKANLERALAVFTRSNPGVSVAWLRPCAIVQRAAAGEFTRWLLPPFVPRATVGRVLPLPLWPGLRLQLVHSDDVASALELLVTGRAVGPFNVAAGAPLDAAALARTIGGPRVPLPRRVLAVPAWLGWRIGVAPLHPRWLILADRVALVDCGRAHSELGWRPEHSATQSLEEFVEGIREGGGTTSPALVPSRGLARLGTVSPGTPAFRSQA